MKINMEALQKSKNRTTLQTSNVTSRYMSKGNEISYVEETPAFLFTAALFTNQDILTTKCPSIHEENVGNIHTK